MSTTTQIKTLPAYTRSYLQLVEHAISAFFVHESSKANPYQKKYIPA
jgi:hypothetical protein